MQCGTGLAGGFGRNFISCCNPTKSFDENDDLVCAVNPPKILPTSVWLVLDDPIIAIQVQAKVQAGCLRSNNGNGLGKLAIGMAWYLAADHLQETLRE